MFLFVTAQPDRSHRGLRAVCRIMPVGLLALGLAGCGASGAADAKSTVTATAVTTVTATQTASAAPSSVLSTSAPPSTKQPETSQPSSVQTGVVPSVVGLNHQLAQDTMQAAGFFELQRHLLGDSEPGAPAHDIEIGCGAQGVDRRAPVQGQG